MRRIGLGDTFVEHGEPALLKELHGLSVAQVKDVVRGWVHSGAREQTMVS